MCITGRDLGKCSVAEEKLEEMECIVAAAFGANSFCSSLNFKTKFSPSPHQTYAR